jgi:hypothetical protein
MPITFAETNFIDTSSYMPAPGGGTCSWGSAQPLQQQQQQQEQQQECKQAPPTTAQTWKGTSGRALATLLCQQSVTACCQVIFHTKTPAGKTDAIHNQQQGSHAGLITTRHNNVTRVL